MIVKIKKFQPVQKWPFVHILHLPTTDSKNITNFNIFLIIYWREVNLNWFVETKYTRFFILVW